MKLPKLKGIVKTVKKFIGDPNVLTAAGCILFVVTVVEAVKATPKVHDILEENADATPIEKVVAVAKEPEVIKAAVAGAGAIGCVIASNRVSADRIATMGALWEMSKTGFAEYKDRAKDILGVEKAEELDRKIHTNAIDDLLKDERKIINTGHGEQLFIFDLTGQVFRSNGNFIERMFNNLNNELQQDCSVTVNEFLLDLGVPTIEGFKHQGWNIDELPCRKVEYEFDPYMNEDNQAVVRIVLCHGSEPKPTFTSAWGRSR